MRAPVTLLLLATASFAEGEPVRGFPNWAERVVLEWANRARVDPATDLAGCSPCSDLSCYAPQPPLAWALGTNRSARFHADEMTRQGYFAHDSHCTLVQNIASLYPENCDGSASCACAGGTSTCSGGCTPWYGRVQLFGAGPTGEIIASSPDPNGAFYLWLREPFTTSANPCQFSVGSGGTNGHRWLLLTSAGALGAGVTTMSVGDFTGGGPTGKIASGSHYPRQAPTVEAWANWYDIAGPSSAQVNVGGVCQPMALARGAAANGAYRALISNVAMGCHRYFFEFADAAGNRVTYPTTGSLGIGDTTCADWDASQPPPCGSSASPADAGRPVADAGTLASHPEAPHDPDAGSDGPSRFRAEEGCGCASAPLAPIAFVLLMVLRHVRMRRPRIWQSAPPSSP